MLCVFKVKMYALYVHALFLTAVAAQTTIDVDPSILEGIFGKPPTPATSKTPTEKPLEEVKVKPTDKPTNLLDKNGESCQCVPYYLCDTDLNAIHVHNSSVTGVNVIDIRFREDDCQESIERCCKNPKTEEELPPPPEPAKPRGCGYRNPNGLDFQITGGTGQEAQFGEFPWVLAVLGVDNSYAGVGVLIHPQVALTGAHIVASFAPEAIKVRAGEWDTQTTKERLKFQESTVKEIYIHKDFHPKSLKNDMALLLLENPVTLGDHINVICMPQQDENFDNYKGCVANGWGKDVFGQQGRYAVILKRVAIDMVPHARCGDLLRLTRLGHNFKLHQSFVCAGGEDGKDTCKGDGGAPLACPLGDDRYKLSGLVAWGIGCGQKDVPAVYVNVAAFRNWVDDKMAAWELDTSVFEL